MSEIPRDLWRTIYDIQGEAQQAAEGDRACRSIEDTWARLEKVLPPPYSAAPDLLEALKAIINEPCSSYDELDPDFFVEIVTKAGVLNRAYDAIAKAEARNTTERDDG